MVPSVQVARAGTTLCNLTANAYVDYFYSEQQAVNAANTAISTVYVTLCDDITTGTSATAAELVAGGGLAEWANYGLGNFRAHLRKITTAGADSAYTNFAATNSNNYLQFGPFNTMVTAQSAAADTLNANASTSTEGCYTAAGTFWSAATFTIWVASFAMGTQSCVDFASDGFTITGMVSFYRFGTSLTLTPNTTDATAVPVILENAVKTATLVGSAPFSANPATLNAGAHIGSIVQVICEVMDKSTLATGTQAMFLLTTP